MEWWNKLRILLKRNNFRSELDEELTFHIESLERELIEQGIAPEEARRQARLRFGGRDSVEERSHGAVAFTFESVVQDVRFAVRVLRKNRVLSSVIVLSLAIAMGANVAVFTVMNSVMLRNVPVRAPEELLMLSSAIKRDFFPEKFVHDYEGSIDDEAHSAMQVGTSVSLDVFETLRRDSQSFDSVVAFSANEDKVNVGLGNRAESATVQAVSGNFFNGLGVVPLLGRNLQSSDDAASAAPVVVATYKFFVNQLGGDRSLIGKTITINNTPAQLVGVAPPDFYGLDPTVATDFWEPISFYRILNERRTDMDENYASPYVWWLTVVGRLKPGVTPQAAHAETSVLFSRAIHAPDNAPQDGTVPLLRLSPAGRGVDTLRRRYATSLWLLMGMVGVVLLIACANVAALMLARATARQREVATRISLGARRSRVIRQLLTEAMLLSIGGGVVGVALAQWWTTVLVSLLSRKDAVGLAVHVDPRVMLFAFAVSIVCGVAFGLPTAVRATRVALASTLQSGRTSSNLASRRFLAGKVLVAAQVALSIMLLVTAGLLVRTLKKLETVGLGFEPNNLASFNVSPGINGYTPEKLRAYYRELQDRVRSLPGVTSVSYAQFGPVGDSSSSGLVYIPGFNTQEKRSDYWRHIVGPQYFETLKIPIVAGRAISQRDSETATHAVVVNQTMTKLYFGGANPIGRTISLGSHNDPQSYEIVGVAADAKYSKIRRDIPPVVYIPLAQHHAVQRTQFLVRYRGDVAAIQHEITALALQMDPTVPVIDFKTEDETIALHLTMEKVFATLSSGFAGVGLLLACVGLYGTVAYTVTQRTNEIGVRIALGAARENILRLVLGDTLRVVLCGVAIGLPAAWIGAQALKAQLYGLSPHDGVTLAATLVIALVVTLVAGWVPAAKASKIDPMVALRYE